ncbi:ABC transporter related protein [Desulfovibrio sp. X2]|uniref:ATP-binding cassette domain-containing protein n=1 Tax=Desulfovibrio sp. X2 TaxID=941449 RepID=UPI000358F311|nr:ABC transporter ATP-binding protein [Desulfovibrio sp. X2]EPR39182.1 ABC transporter related protein [Desulfovibrio sp. X2]
MVLDIQGLRVRYGRREAVCKVSLSVDAGEVVALYGYNGAGKSTLLRAVAGLARRAGGEVLLDGRDTRKAEARRGLRYVPESPVLFSHLSGEAHVRVFADAWRLDPDPAFEAAEALGLGPRMAQRPATWSQGQRQKLMLALACLGDPTCVLLDDPVSALDPRSGREAMALMRGLAREHGTAVLLTGQRPRDSAAAVDRFVCLHEGRAVSEGVAAGRGEEAVARAVEAALEASWE